ncbi:MAG: hypothetical protein ACYC3I_09195 [Gemmataceae bacterium]
MLIVALLLNPRETQGQFRGNLMPGAPLVWPAPFVPPVAVAGFGGFGGFGFPAFGFNGFGLAPGLGFGGVGFNGFGFNGLGLAPGFGFPGFGFNGFGFNGFGMLPGFGFNGFGFNGFGMVPGFGLPGFGFPVVGFGGMTSFALGVGFPGGVVNVGVAGVSPWGLRRLAPLPIAAGFAGKGLGGFNGGNGL